MKKILYLLMIGLLSLTGAYSQVRLGVLGGLHSANVLEYNDIRGWDTTTKKFYSPRTGAQAGIILDIPLGKNFYFQPAITYTTKGRQYTKNNDSAAMKASDTVYSKQSLSLSYIDIPLYLTYKIPLSKNHKNSFFVSGGPYISFYYSGKITQQSLTYTEQQYSNVSTPLTVGKGPDTYTTIDAGVNARAGFELGTVFLNAYLSEGLTSFYHPPAAYIGNYYHLLMGASIGFWLTSVSAPAPPPPKDTDKDGIPDDQDLCPLQPGSLKWHGCPVPDTDHDGIDDEHDSCKTIPGFARYNGCPVPDTDHDGIDDEHDACPTVAGLGRYNGCPIPDRDGDGINDEEDKCPDSAGTAENHGCPVVVAIKKETTEKLNYIARSILFNPSSDQLTDGSFTALDTLATLLLDHPELHLTIEGYTDNSGQPKKNLVLSQKRALAVEKYLISKGVPATRLKSAGYGQEHPLADNQTEEGRAANRRVELKISTQ